MNKNRTFERKTTLESSDPSQTNHRAEMKSPNNRISSIKSLSFKDIPFSQHIFGDQPTYEPKVSSATDFNPERWNFEPKQNNFENQLVQKTSETESKNGFLQARLACINKKKDAKGLLKRKSVIEDVDHDFFDDKVITFRTIRNSRQDEELKQFGQPLI